MSKPALDAVVVVEGKTDKDLLSSFFDCDIVTTNGSALSKDTIEYIRALALRRTVVVLTDPDAPGKKIRDELNQAIPNLKNAYLPKEKCIKNHKVGVAESDYDTIKEALAFALDTKKASESNLDMKDLFDLGLSGRPDAAERRHTFEIEYHFGPTNAKTFLARCRALGLNRQDLENQK